MAHQCQSFADFALACTTMRSSNERLVFEGVSRNRRDACIFALEQRDAFAPPALPLSTVAKLWMQLGCSIDYRRERLIQNSNTTGTATHHQHALSASARSGTASSRPGEAPRSSSGGVLVQEWVTVIVCSRRVNAGNCYVAALELDPRSNAAGWYNLGCWLSTETREAVKAFQKGEPFISGEQQTAPPPSASSKSGGAGGASATKEATTKTKDSAGGASAAGSSSASAITVSVGPDGLPLPAPVPRFELPTITVSKKAYTAPVCFVQTIAIDPRFDGGWLNLGASLALEDAIGKRLPVSWEASVPRTARIGEATVTRQQCYVKELESDYAHAGALGGRSDKRGAGSRRARTRFYIDHAGAASEMAYYCSSADSAEEDIAATMRRRQRERVEGYNGLAITKGTHGPSRAAVRALAWINLSSTMESLNEAVDVAAPAIADLVRSRFSANETTTVTSGSFEAVVSSSTEGVRSPVLPKNTPNTEATTATATTTESTTQAATGATTATAGSKPAKPPRRSLNKRDCLQYAVIEDPTLARAWQTLGTVLLPNERASLYGPGGAHASLDRIECMVRAMDLAGSSEDSASAWSTLATALFEDDQRERRTTRAACRRVAPRGRQPAPSPAVPSPAAIPPSPKTLDCMDCVEEVLRKAPNDAKAWHLAASMFQYFVEGLTPATVAKQREDALKGQASAPPPPPPPTQPDTATAGSSELPLPAFITFRKRRIASARDCFAEVVRCDPKDGPAWYALGMSLYYDPAGKAGGPPPTVRIYHAPASSAGASAQAPGDAYEDITAKECFNRAQALGAMSRYACCTIM